MCFPAHPSPPRQRPCEGWAVEKPQGFPARAGFAGVADSSRGRVLKTAVALAEAQQQSPTHPQRLRAGNAFRDLPAKMSADSALPAASTTDNNHSNRIKRLIHLKQHLVKKGNLIGNVVCNLNVKGEIASALPAVHSHKPAVSGGDKENVKEALCASAPCAC